MRRMRVTESNQKSHITWQLFLFVPVLFAAGACFYGSQNGFSDRNRYFDSSSQIHDEYFLISPESQLHSQYTAVTNSKIFFLSQKIRCFRSNKWHTLHKFDLMDVSTYSTTELSCSSLSLSHFLSCSRLLAFFFSHSISLSLFWHRRCAFFSSVRSK